MVLPSRTPEQQERRINLTKLPEDLKVENARGVLRTLEQGESLILVDDMDPTWIVELLWRNYFDPTKWETETEWTKKHYSSPGDRFEVRLRKTESG